MVSTAVYMSLVMFSRVPRPPYNSVPGKKNIEGMVNAQPSAELHIENEWLLNRKKSRSKFFLYHIKA